MHCPSVLVRGLADLTLLDVLLLAEKLAASTNAHREDDTMAQIQQFGLWGLSLGHCLETTLSSMMQPSSWNTFSFEPALFPVLWSQGLQVRV